MKIDNQHPSLVRQTPTESRQGTQKAQGTQGGERHDVGTASVTHLSQAATDSSQDIDTVRVEEIRDAIREGKLDIRAERIADGLVASVQDLLNQENGKQ